MSSPHLDAAVHATAPLHRLLPIAVLALVSAAPAAAQHSDVHLGVLGNALVVDPNDTKPVDALGRRIYASEFDEAGTALPFGPNPGFATPEEGFDSPAHSLLSPGAVLGLTPQGTLLFWDGTAWDAAPASGETLHIARAAGPITFWDYALDRNGVAVTDPLDPDLGVIGFAFGDGSFHQHVDFYLEQGGFTGIPATGAYAFALQLVSPGLTSSGSFLIVLNNGLEAESFDAALAALAVPEPRTYVLMLTGLAVLAAARRVRARQRNGRSE